ncbi:MAG: hypothetical protein FOGNACKC_05064 [Anaerolineae bacterium]|nr:hypothetical protein [Anaerolineae bacterium]
MNDHFKIWIALFVMAASGFWGVMLSAHAAGPWYVAPGGSDSNDCLNPSTTCASINGVLAKPGFTAGDSVLVATGTYTGTGTEVVLLDKSVILSGGWNTGFTTQSGTTILDGETTRRGITVISGVMVTIERITIQNGYSFSFGGGILNEGGTLNLDHINVTGNTAGNGGGIYNNYSGIVTLNNSIISKNSGEFSNAGIANSGTFYLNNSFVNDNPDSMGIANSGTFTLNNSVVSGHSYNGIINYSGTLIVNNCTVEGNFGRGLYNDRGIVTLNNSTISGNATDGIENSYDAIVTLNNTTISNNQGIGVKNSFSSATANLRNSIIARNTSGDCNGTLMSLGYNLVSNTTGCTFAAATGDQTKVDAHLGPLDGFPAYHPLLVGSPAINAGNPSGCTGSTGLLTTDQRGFPRFGRCDIGAYEMQPIGFSTKTIDQAVVQPGDAVTYSIVLNNGGPTNLLNVHVTDTLPPLLTYVNGSLTASDGSYSYNNGVINWTGSVNTGQTVDISYEAVVSPTLGSIVNSAVISGGGETITRTATVTVQDSQLCKLTKHPGNPVLSIGANGTWDDNAVWRPMVLKETGGYKMWYVADDGSTSSRIGLATSGDGIIWNKSANNPVLSPTAAWEANGISGGSVIYDNGEYKLWYTGFDSSGIGRIGYATSPDGINWTKYGGNPVLNVGYLGSWEDADVMFPSVLKRGDIYHMWYEGNDGSGQSTHRIGHSTSSNGTNWTKDAANPVLDVGPPGDWDWLNAYAPSVIDYNSTFVMWYSGQTLPDAWQTGYALSKDGTNWTRQGLLIPEGATGAFDNASADYATAIAAGDVFKLWYSGHNGSYYAIGYATAEVCSAINPAPPTTNQIFLPVVFKGASSCPAYYTDDFSDSASGWPISDNSDRRYAYVGSEYQIWVKKPSSGWFVSPGAKAVDFTAAVNARRTSSTSGSYGIQFGINENWDQLYEFVIGSNNYSVWSYNNGFWTPLKNWTYSPAIKTGTGWNRLKVIRQGNSISVYVNNQLLTTVIDGSLTGFRRIGLAAYSPSSSGLDFRFDNFSLYPADCGVSAAETGFEMGKPGTFGGPAPARP